MNLWRQYSIRIVLGLILVLSGIYVGHRVLFPPLPLVGVIQWVSEPRNFEEGTQGVIEGLREEGFQDGLNIRLEIRNVRGERDEAAAAAREFQEKGIRLLITVGTVPTLIALEVTRNSQIPIVYTNVGFPDATGLSRPAPPEAIRFTGTSAEVPVLEQLRFLLLARPGLKRLGILFCTATPQAVACGKATETESPKIGLIPFSRTVPDDRPEPLHQVLTDLIDQGIEALLIPFDPVLRKPKNLKLICDAALQAAIPVMVPDGHSVAHGPLLAYHCDFMDMGRQSGRQAAQVLKGVPLDQVPPESPQIKKLTINLKVAQELGLLLPRRLVCQAHHFYQESQ
ncbi:MAG: ABC transporter substrate-binding protein [Deltaproteobacteria bacterium]|nr:ABC transporter substrate-binding protein [Deltaproteobacteria bacterium]